jgi:hypothetical protein
MCVCVTCHKGPDVCLSPAHALASGLVYFMDLLADSMAGCEEQDQFQLNKAAGGMHPMPMMPFQAPPFYGNLGGMNPNMPPNLPGGFNPDMPMDPHMMASLYQGGMGGGMGGNMGGGMGGNNFDQSGGVPNYNYTPYSAPQPSAEQLASIPKEETEAYKEVNCHHNSIYSFMQLFFIIIITITATSLHTLSIIIIIINTRSTSASTIAPWRRRWLSTKSTLPSPCPLLLSRPCLPPLTGWGRPLRCWT